MALASKRSLAASTKQAQRRLSCSALQSRPTHVNPKGHADIGQSEDQHDGLVAGTAVGSQFNRPACRLVDQMEFLLYGDLLFDGPFYAVAQSEIVGQEIPDAAADRVDVQLLVIAVVNAKNIA